MARLSTSYMGIPLASPVVVGACTLSRRVTNFKNAQEAGAGAMVVYSLFQEQMELEEEQFEEVLSYGANHYAESLTYSAPHASRRALRNTYCGSKGPAKRWRCLYWEA